MIRLMSDCLLRISEVVAVNVGDFQEKTLTLRASKTDQEGAGESLYVCEPTRKVLNRYRELSGITDGVFFRHIRRGDHIQSDRLTPHSARRIIKKRAANAGGKDLSPGIPFASDLPSRSHKLGQPSSICESQAAGNLHRCPRITPNPNSPNAAQSQDSKMENDK